MNRRWVAITLYGAVAGLEVSWFWAFLDLLNQKTAGGSLPLLFLLGFYPLAFVSHRMLRRLPWKKAIPLGCLAWAAKKGHARNPAQTPYEFLQGLTLWLPERRGDLTSITEQYVRSRYGLSAPTESGMEELRQSCQRIRQTHFKRGAKKMLDHGATFPL